MSKLGVTCGDWQDLEIVFELVEADSLKLQSLKKPNQDSSWSNAVKWQNHGDYLTTKRSTKRSTSQLLCCSALSIGRFGSLDSLAVGCRASSWFALPQTSRCQPILTSNTYGWCLDVSSGLLTGKRFSNTTSHVFVSMCHSMLQLALQKLYVCRANPILTGQKPRP